MGKWTTYHPAVFILTFFSYAFYHAIRKTLSNVKSSISDEWTPCSIYVNGTVSQSCTPVSTWSRQSSTSFFKDRDEAEEFLGIVDASFLFAYALGLYISGFIADRQDMRLVLSTGMVLTAVVVFIFGPVLEWSGSYSEPAYISLMVLNGLLQSTGWPCVVAVMGNWFGKGSRGLVLGLWSACQSSGNILGALMVSAVVDYGYEYAFLLTSSVLFAGGIVVFFGLVPTPREVGLPIADENEDGRRVDIDNQITMVQIVEETSEGKYFKTDPQNETKLDSVSGRANGYSLDGERTPENESSGASNVVEKSHELKSLSSVHSSAQTAVTSVPKVPAETEADFKSVETEADPRNVETDADARSAETTRPKAVSFLTAVCLPGVIPYSLAYAFLTVSYTHLTLPTTAEV